MNKFNLRLPNNCFVCYDKWVFMKLYYYLLHKLYNLRNFLTYINLYLLPGYH